MKRLTPFFLYLVLVVVSCYQGHGLSPPGEISGIQGHITYVGTWPDSTNEVRLAVLKEYPIGMTDPDSLLTFVMEKLAGLSDPLPLFVTEYDYEITVDAGEYAWVLVVWLPENLFDLKELGAYYENLENMEVPTPVTVPPNVMIQGIDIIADFDNLNNDRPFFKREDTSWIK